MRPCSLICLAEGLRSLPARTLPAFEAQLSERREVLRSIKPHEAASVVALVDALDGCGCCGAAALAGFVFSFSIPQIGKEFDLLKVCDDTVVNIELKSESVPRAKVVAQLVRNRHYLKSLGRTVHAYTFVLGQSSLFELGTADEAHEVGIERLAAVLASAGTPFDGQVESLFHPREYLVSPTADTARFLAHEYFLTNQQEEIKHALVRTIDEERLPAAFVVTGSAGTGKSLLLYDLALDLGCERDAVVVQCGVMTEAHRTLDASQDSFAIVGANALASDDLGGCHLVFVDEAERLDEDALADLASRVAETGGVLYLSVDEYQAVQSVSVIRDRVQAAFPRAVAFRRLTGRIRTNRELSGFIRILFGLTDGVARVMTTHVKVAFARDADAAAGILHCYRDMGYTTPVLSLPHGLRYVPDRCEVAGGFLECDRVAVVVPEGLRVARGGGLVLADADDGGEVFCQELYQALTRAREDIALVVAGDEVLFEQLLALLGIVTATTEPL